MLPSCPCPHCGFVLIDDDEPLDDCPGCGVPWVGSQTGDVLLASVLGERPFPTPQPPVIETAPPAASKSTGRVLLATLLVAAAIVALYESVLLPRRTKTQIVPALQSSARDVAQAARAADSAREDTLSAVQSEHAAAVTAQRVAEQSLAATRTRFTDLERTHGETLEMLRSTQAERDQLVRDLSALEEEFALTQSSQTGAFLRQWQTLGPLTGAERSLQEEVEQQPFRSSLRVAGVQGRLQWKLYESPEDRVSLNKAFDNFTKVGHCYLLTWVYSADSQPVQLSIGSDDGCCLWVNRELVLERRGSRSASPGQDRVPTELQAGWNEVLAFVDNSGGSDWALIVELRTADGTQPLRFSHVATPPKRVSRKD